MNVMGYRSEVAISIKKNVFENASEKVKAAFNDVFPKGPYRETSSNVVFYEEWIKWYPDFDENIKDIMDYLSSIYDEAVSSCGFIRVGEEDGDTEYEFNPDENGISWIRRIEIDV